MGVQEDKTEVYSHVDQARLKIKHHQQHAAFVEAYGKLQSVKGRLSSFEPSAIHSEPLGNLLTESLELRVTAEHAAGKAVQSEEAQRFFSKVRAVDEGVATLIEVKKESADIAELLARLSSEGNDGLKREFLRLAAAYFAESGAPLGATFESLLKDAEEKTRELAERQRSIAENQSAIVGHVEAVAARARETDDAIAKGRAEAQAIAAEVRVQYSKTEGELRDAFKSTMDQMGKRFTEFEEHAKSQSNETLIMLQKSESDARKIVQVVGNIGVTGNYQNVANSEDKEAKGWRRMTVGFFVLGIITAAALFFPALWLDKTLDFGAVAARISLAAAFVLPAFYTARESARHRTNSDTARRTELELASLGPFTELMPEEQKHAIRKELTPRFFGKDVAPHEIKEPVSLEGMASVIKEVRSLVRTAKK